MVKGKVFLRGLRKFWVVINWRMNSYQVRLSEARLIAARLSEARDDCIVSTP